METTQEQLNARVRDSGQMPVASPTIPQAITPESLQPVTPIQLPPAPTSLSGFSTSTSIPNPTIPTAESIINTGANPTPTEKQQTGFLNKIASLIGGNKTKTQIQNETETSAGLPSITNTLNDLNTQLEGLNNQAIALGNEAQYTIPNQMQEDAKGRGVTAAGLAPITASQLRQNQIKQGAIATQALTLKSAIYGAQGKYNIAKDAADKAAEAQYEAQQQQIDYQKAQLDAIAPTLNKEEKAQALIVQSQLQDRQIKIDNAKEDKKTILALATATLKLYPNDPAAQYAAQQALAESNKEQPDLQTVLSLVGKYQQDPVAVENAVLQNKKLRADIAKINADAAANGVQPITNKDAAQYSGALSVILGSGKFTKDQKNSIVSSVNNGEDPVAVIKNQAKQIMPNTQAVQLDKYETIKAQTENIQSLLKDYYATGGKTNIFSGNLEKTINKLGQVDNPTLVQIASNIASSLQAYRNAVSGTAYSEQEGKDIAAIFPGINKSEGLNDAIIQGRLKFIDSTIDAQYRNTLGTTYDSIKNAQGNQAPVSQKQTLSVDDAYAEYLKTVGQTIQPTPTKKSLIDPSISQGYKGFSLSSIFK